MIEPLRFSFEVECPQEHAFETWTKRIGTWWGEVTIWEPPARFGYLWHLRRDRVDATDVEIRFIARDAATTLVEIEHRAWERLGAGGQEWRDRNRGGWESLLPHYRRAVE